MTEIDGVFVCTSPLSHASIIEKCLINKWNVFTELNLVADKYEENMNLAKKNDCVLFLSSTFFYRDEISYIRDRIAEKKKLNYVYHIGQYLPDWHPWESYKNFFVGSEKTNGCREIMAIELPWLSEAFGDIVDYNVVADKMSELGITYNDNYMLQVIHKNGNKGTLIVDVVCPYAVRKLEVYGENTYLSWDGTPTTLMEFDTKNRRMEKVNLDSNMEHMDGYNSFIIENAYQNEIQDFFDVILDKKKQEYGFEKDLKILNLIDKIEGIV